MCGLPHVQVTPYSFFGHRALVAATAEPQGPRCASPRSPVTAYTEITGGLKNKKKKSLEDGIVHAG